jgi:hypothetical protein
MAFGHSDSHTALSSNYCFSQKSAWKSDGSKLFMQSIWLIFKKTWYYKDNVKVFKNFEKFG